jgi:hypothetical protein
MFTKQKGFLSLRLVVQPTISYSKIIVIAEAVFLAPEKYAEDLQSLQKRFSTIRFDRLLQTAAAECFMQSRCSEFMFVDRPSYSVTLCLAGRKYALII